MMLHGLILGFLFFYQASCQQVPQQQAVPIGGQQQAVPQFRFCHCDELEQCHKDQTVQQSDLFSKCRQECGVALLPNDSIDQVAQCYQAYEEGKRNHKNSKHQCVEKFISRPCISDQQHQSAPPPQTTLTVDSSKISTHKTKRNYKTLLPTHLSLYNTCVKTCRKNRGMVQFNVDGTPVKTATKPASNCQNVDPAKTTLKPEKGYASCAVKLNCQLLPLDKNVEKQAKQICKYQKAQVEDVEVKLCTCLENALKQNFQCTTADTCSSPSGQTGQKSCEGTGSK